MNKHVFVAVLLAGVLGLSALAAGQKQLDIALEGPWILFKDTINVKGNPVPVLVAVAPMGATDTEPIDEEDHFHHYPQLGSGNGFYLPTPTSSSLGIFCLAFDRQCAPPAGSTLTPDPNYTKEDILTLTGNSTNRQWRSYGAKNEVVILPMPDFYHADGAWPIQFHDASHKPDVYYNRKTYPIGLVLHYTTAQAARLRLYRCKSPVQSVTTDCQDEAHDDNQPPHLIEVTNTGTLRLQMRAPDSTSDCDHHVRYGFHQMLELLDPNFTVYTSYRYIEPAKEMDSSDTNDNGIFETDTSSHPCFDYDPDDQDDNLSTATLHHAVATQVKEANTTNPFTNALNTINAQWPARNPQLDAKQSFLLQSARKPLNEALRLAGSLRISDVRRMGVLAEESAQQISSVIAELQLQAQRNFHDVSDEVNKLEKLDRSLKAFADGTKNGADCRAAQVLVQ